MKYLTRDEVLLSLGPVHTKAPEVFVFPPETRYPILSVQQKTPTKVQAVIGWKPRPFYKTSIALAAIEMSDAQYESLPEDETLV